MNIKISEIKQNCLCNLKCSKTNNVTAFHIMKDRVSYLTLYLNEINPTERLALCSRDFIIEPDSFVTFPFYSTELNVECVFVTVIYYFRTSVFYFVPLYSVSCKSGTVQQAVE